MDQVKSRTTAADFFIYFGVLIGLYVSTVSLISLSFDLINKWLPDVTTGYYSYDYSVEGIRFALAALIIFFPVFMYLSRIATKAIALTPEKKEMWVRRWFYFLTLFLTGLAIAIDLVILVYRFIGGEDLTLRFALKVLVVLVVCFVIFRFYLYELRRDVSLLTPNRKYFAYTVWLVFIIVVVISIFTIGSPTQQRNIRLDQQRVDDLSSIQNAIGSYYRINFVLPRDLSTLSKAGEYYLNSITDPVTKSQYEYTIMSKTAYELCAVFSLPNDQTDQTRGTSPAKMDNWKHTAGRDCFEQEVAPSSEFDLKIPKPLQI